jgi:outer membrane protein OmpA-like peptidoglycan-associated protein
MQRKALWFAAGPILACLALIPGGAAADTKLVQDGEGMEARLFRPAVDTKGHFTQDSTPVLPHLSLSVGLMLDFGFHQWVAVEQNDSPLHPDAYGDTMVDRYITTLLMLNFGLFDRAVVGLQLPLIIPAGHMYYDDEDGERGWSSKGTFGDLAIHAKVHLTRANFHLIGVGLVLQYQAPTGKSELLTGEPGGGALSGKLIVDVEPARWYRAALNLGGRYAFGLEEENHLNWNGATPLTLFEYGPMLTFGLGQSFVLWPGLMDFVLEAYGSQLATGFGDRGYTSMEVAGGFKFYVEENSYLMAGYAHGIPLGGTESGYGFQAMEHRMFLGFAFEPSMPDADGDGIPDAWDQCPQEAEDRDGFEDSDGCPDPDNDGDGLCDPWVVKQGLQARHAKVCKGEDLCPLVPGKPEHGGCPPPPEDESEAERVRIEEEQQDVEVLDGAIKTLKKIYFEYNSEQIKEESFPILDQVAAVILENPQIDLIEVQGHADERGPERYNLDLTTKRAASVKRYLADKGIDKKRLRSMGYGEYCPVKLGSAEEDWEENRRVEFKVLKVRGESTGVDTGCPRAKRKGVVSPPVK